MDSNPYRNVHDENPFIRKLINYSKEMDIHSYKHVHDKINKNMETHSYRDVHDENLYKNNMYSHSCKYVHDENP